jgi:hypothetical protein
VIRVSSSSTLSSHHSTVSTSVPILHVHCAMTAWAEVLRPCEPCRASPRSRLLGRWGGVLTFGRLPAISLVARSGLRVSDGSHLPCGG